MHNTTPEGWDLMMSLQPSSHLVMRTLNFHNVELPQICSLYFAWQNKRIILKKYGNHKTAAGTRGNVYHILRHHGV